MSESKIISAAFLVSFAGHCLFLGIPGFNFSVPPEIKKAEKKNDIKVSFETGRPALLPIIDLMGEEKKLKEVEQDLEQPVPEKKLPQPVTGQLSRKHFEEKVKVVSTDKEAMLRYQDMVKQRIEQARKYPLWAKEHGIEGVAHLYFIVLTDGMEHGLKIIRSSGSSILDEEALATVKRACPFPPVPKKVSSLPVEMQVAIVFSLSKDEKANFKKDN